MANQPQDLGRQPAHPFAQTSETFQFTGTQHAGLTKREAAAIAAMQGLATGQRVSEGEAVAATLIAAGAVDLADALLAELAKDGAL